MITKVVHGWRPGGLIAYLMGPGRAQEHHQPRVIASWDGRDGGWQPASTGPSAFDLELGPIIRALRAPAVAAGLPEHPDALGKVGYVWHCSARLAATDRVLGDEEWAGIARELLDGAGVASTQDPGGPRWFAIRHADDHIHIAVVLVRQDSGRRFWPYRDYPRLREAAMRIEHRLGVTITAGADGTAAPAPTRGELEKAARQGREPARVELARAVRAAAVASTDPESFIAAVEVAGYAAQLRRAPSGDPLGFKVARLGDVTATGAPVFYSGSKLAPDLSMPRLLTRWADISDDAGVGDPGRVARRQARRAHLSIAATRRDDGVDDPGEIVHATGDLLAAIRGRRWAGDELGVAADLFDRASRAPGRVVGRPSSVSLGLRRAARQLIRQRRSTVDGDFAAAIALLIAVAALVREIAGWQRDCGRTHQAAAAQQSAESIDRWLGSVSIIDGAAGVSRSRNRAVEHVAVDEQPRF